MIELAKRLQSDGVDVILDVWDLAPGQDKNVFMEQTVSNPAIKRVLLVCNQDYQRKADGRQGGVGTESLIMSQEVYAHADQTKFIPLVFEVDEKEKACVPTFIHSRIYFDLREGEHYEDSYEQLIRNIFDKPIHRKPPLGTRPAYLEENSTPPLLTGRRVETLKRAFLDNRPNAPLLVEDYYATFLKALAEFEPGAQEVTTQNPLRGRRPVSRRCDPCAMISWLSWISTCPYRWLLTSTPCMIFWSNWPLTWMPKQFSPMATTNWVASGSTTCVFLRTNWLYTWRRLCLKPKVRRAG